MQFLTLGKRHALVPLAVQPARGLGRRAAQGAVAVLAAALWSGVSTGRLPVGGARVGSVGIVPLDTSREAAAAVWHSLALHPSVLIGAAVIGVASAGLARIRRISKYGIAVVGAALVAGTIALGGSVWACLLVAFVWALAGVGAARSGR